VPQLSAAKVNRFPSLLAIVVGFDVAPSRDPLRIVDICPVIRLVIIPSPISEDKYMPKYAIERQYLVPVYQHLFIDAPDLDAACRQALDHDDWDSSETDYDNSRETTIACAVEIPSGKTGCNGGTDATASEMIYQAGLPDLDIPRQFRSDDDVSRASLEVRSLLLEIAEIDAHGDNGPVGVLADRKRAILQQLADYRNPDALLEPRDPVMRRFDNRELAAVLAGLRLYQRFRNSLYDPNSFLAEAWSRAGGFADLSEIATIADSGGAVDPLVEHEVDVLCERLNGDVR
jgi:hypothetical protein